MNLKEQLAEAKRKAKALEKSGNFDTVHHENVRRLQQLIREAKAPKSKPQKGGISNA